MFKFIAALLPSLCSAALGQGLTLTRITPDHGQVSGDTVLFIHGAGFQPGVRVWIGDKVAVAVSVLSPTLLRARSLPGMPGPADVRVDVGGVSQTLSAGFNYLQFAVAANHIDSQGLSVPRAGSKVLSLLDGRFLIVDGSTMSGGSALASADLYDPETGTVTLIPQICHQPRTAAAVTCLADGRVLLLGGTATGGGVLPPGQLLDTAEVYDPTLHTTQDLGAVLPAPRWGIGSTLLPDGRVLLVGGLTAASGSATQDAFIFDPATNSVTAAANLPFSTFGQAQALLGNGDVLAVGGMTSWGGACVGSHANVAVFHTASGTWLQLIPGLPANRHNSQAVLLPDGRVAIVGGYRTNCDPYLGATTIDVYDTSSRTFAVSPAQFSDPVDMVVGLRADGQIIGAGGIPWITGAAFTPAVDQIRQFDAEGQVVVQTGTMTTQRVAAFGCFGQDGSVLIAGGLPGAQVGQMTPALQSAELLPPLPQFIAFGAGCSGNPALHPAMTSVGVPHIGNQSFAVAVHNVAPGSLALLALGLSNEIWGTTMLPYPIPGASCRVLVSPDAVISAVVGTVGTASIPQPIPPTLPYGFKMFVQWFCLTPTLGLEASPEAICWLR